MATTDEKSTLTATTRVGRYLSVLPLIKTKKPAGQSTNPRNANIARQML